MSIVLHEAPLLWQVEWLCNIGDIFTLKKTILTKLHILLPDHPVITLLGIYPKELKTCPHKNLHMDIYGSFIRNCQNLEATKMFFST